MLFLSRSLLGSATLLFCGCSLIGLSDSAPPPAREFIPGIPDLQIGQSWKEADGAIRSICPACEAPRIGTSALYKIDSSSISTVTLKLKKAGPPRDPENPQVVLILVGYKKPYYRWEETLRTHLGEPEKNEDGVLIWKLDNPYCVVTYIAGNLIVADRSTGTLQF